MSEPMAAMALEVEVDGAVRRITLAPTASNAGQYVAHIDGRAVAVDLFEPMPGVLSLLIGEGGGRAYRCVRTSVAGEQTMVVGGQPHRVAVADPRSLRAQKKRPGAGNGATQIKASMPGRVARVLVSSGDEVAAQQGIVVIEAMKMQNELKAARDGRITDVRVAAGDTVTSGQVLAVLE